MKRNFAKTLLLTLLLIFSISAAGCSGDVKDAENAVQAYLTAVSGLNLDAMEACLSEGKNKDFGIDTSAMSRSYEQTDAYKKAVESMFKSLSGTIEFSFEQTEKTERNKMVVLTKIKFADVNKEAVDEYMQRKTGEYAEDHPELAQRTDIEQSDVGISIMADAYKTFLQTRSKIEKKVPITVVRKGGEWKILNGDENRELKKLFSDIFGTF